MVSFVLCLNCWLILSCAGCSWLCLFYFSTFLFFSKFSKLCSFCGFLRLLIGGLFALSLKFCKYIHKVRHVGYCTVQFDVKVPNKGLLFLNVSKLELLLWEVFQSCQRFNFIFFNSQIITDFVYVINWVNNLASFLNVLVRLINLIFKILLKFVVYLRDLLNLCLKFLHVLTSMIKFGRHFLHLDTLIFSYTFHFLINSSFPLF